MTKLISGRVHKVPSANVSAERYQFLEISEAEPDLGLPSELGQIFTSDLNGNRYWSRLDTANVLETTNQYFTNVRVLQAVDPRLTTANVSELTNLYFTPQRAIAALEGNNVVVNNLTVSGDLEVQGNLVSINTTTLNVEDKNILLANGAVNSAAADGAGITIAGANAEIKYLNTGDLIDINKNVNVQGNISLVGAIQSDADLHVNVDTKSWKFDTNGDLTVPNYVYFKGGTFVGDEPGAGTPTFRMVAPLGYGATIETDSDISGNNYIWTFGKDGVTSIPGSINAQGNVVIDGSFIGNGLIIRNISVTDEILTGNILGQGFTSNTVVVSETLTANIINANSITATGWNGIYTSNVTESPNRLYYTNDRVFSFVTGMSIGDLVDVANIYTHNNNGLIGIQEGQALVWDGNVFIPVFVNSEVANVADLAVKVLNLENQSTANVREAASNLYFTNTRVLDAISLATIRPSEIYSSNIVTDSITANIWHRLFTANVVETAGNLYFTQQRARDSVSNSTGVYYNTSTGVFSIGQDVALTSDVEFRDLTLTGNLFILGNVAYIQANTLRINDPLVQVGYGNPGDQWDLGLVGHYLDAGERHAGFFRDATDKKFKFFSNTTIEPANVNYIDTSEDSFRLAVLVAETFEGNVVGTVSSLSNHTTDNLAEGSNNLYFTNARVVQTVTPILTTANVVELDNLYFTNARTVTAVTPLLTTGNVVETTNQYFTNARVLSNVEQMSINVLADVDITGVAVNSALVWDGTKFIPGSTEAALRSNFANTAGSANVALLADLANLVSSLSNHDTANLAEGTNLYYTNSRVLSALVYANVLVADLTAAGNLVANGLIIRGINVNDSVLTGNINITNIAAANVINANVISSQVWQGLYSGNIIESTNLFFSNTRARNAFIAGRGIIIMDDGTIKSTVGTENFNTSINLGQSYTVTSELAPALTIASTPTVDRYLVRSMHLTNISDNPAFVSANVLYATGNTATLANSIPVPVGGIVEFMDRIQVLQPGDKINVQGFNNAGTPTSNILSLNFSIEQISNDVTYYGTSFTLASSNVETTLISTPQSYAIIESVKFVNLTGTSVPVRLYTKNSNNVIKSYLAYNTQVPPNSSLEILQSPKTLEFTDTLYASYTNTSANSAIAVFPSYRYSSVTTLGVSTASAIPGDNVIISFTTSVTDGSTLYYTLE